MAADPHTEELAAIIQEIRERVRSRYPQGTAGPGVVLPDLMPILHARDAAEGKVASIGSVNPRPPGLLNSIVQSVKKATARALDWHVREQVEYNRAMVNALNAILEALNENNRALSALGARIASLEARSEEYQELRDIRARWSEWHVEWERKLADVESRFLRTVAELSAAVQVRAAQVETAARDAAKTQHAEFMRALWDNIKQVRAELERTIHTELRLIRRRAAIEPPSPAPPAVEARGAAPEIDWLHFAERFRGTEEYVKEKQRIYLPYFAGCGDVLDIGCGRGEFLELAREAGISARGIDLSEELVALCRAKKLEAETADLFVYLDSLPERSLGGIFCAQVIEHLPPARLPEMLRLACTRLSTGGVLVIETPNPECLAILASHFYLDPTHRRPVPPQLLSYYLEEFGMGAIEIRRLSPAVESMPALQSLPEDFREAFFGALDYAIIAKKL
ncbi:MAG TPA: class I SAM-dependent methyltransferase [Bryobacteraceae bacterium]|nr:class I SAM-dependent methyltransferase [Bryobacteraceae bacterium]HOQ44325.1 class I SAM-dependent methyltransferase [Bryobacteraceae bacterium]HPQ16792.1 class I SAM-dependent methyltransferase [Bryobacteraceae bacterium]HPU70643.1 class I SAM-dependent methyltransferase [Bryobacteraceae bacterium]